MCLSARDHCRYPMVVFIEEPDDTVVYGVLDAKHITSCSENGLLLWMAGCDAAYWVLFEEWGKALQRVQELNAKRDEAHHVVFSVRFPVAGFFHFFAEGFLHEHDGLWLFYGDIPLEVAHDDGSFCIEVIWYHDVQ